MEQSVIEKRIAALEKKIVRASDENKVILLKRKEKLEALLEPVVEEPVDEELPWEKEDRTDDDIKLLKEVVVEEEPVVKPEPVIEEEPVVKPEPVIEDLEVLMKKHNEWLSKNQ